MYEEDRERALEMYSEIFDEVGNETSVLQLLVSPTRQAVNLARAYDARDRKYQDDGQEAAYQLVIDELRRQAGTLIPVEPKLEEEDQLSLFNDAQANENVFDGMGFELLPDIQGGSADNTRATQEVVHFPDEDREGEPAPLTPPPAAPIAPVTEEAPAQEVDDFSDAVDAFLAQFSIHDDFEDEQQPEIEKAPVNVIQDEEPAPQPAIPQTPPPLSHDEQEKPASAPGQRQDISTVTLPPQETQPLWSQPQPGPSVTRIELPDMTGTGEEKANIPLLILFILLAIPVGLLCLAVILPLAALSLGLAAASLYLGVFGLISAFGFTVFADILLVFGLSLALAAIGLLLLWVFVWLLFGAIPGVVRGICALGRKLCYREVSA